LAPRLSRTEEGLELLARCFTGKRDDFDDVVIRPRSAQPGGPPLWIAAMSEGGAQRAARFDAHLPKLGRATRCWIRGARRCARRGAIPWSDAWDHPLVIRDRRPGA
jgi:alkanesulfonate monooxygenase SsuD/methylene tetrahydromethanopterin reductase-like flavin-dependent oxidoreductase (luciferase family)